MKKINFLLTLTLMCLPVAAWGASAPTVNLPDNGTYYWWVSAPTGSVSSPPKEESGTSHFSPKSLASGETLYVLDARTGEAAGVLISSKNTAVSLRFADFHPLGASASALIPQASAPAPSPSSPSSATPATSSDNGVGSIVGRVVSWIFGLIVLAGVVWFLKRLYDTRGQTLIQGARRLGVDVPDPNEIAAQASANQPEGLYVAPAPREVDKVPEEVLAAAGGAPVAAPFAWGAPLPDPVPHLVGLDGPTAGQRYDLNQGQASIGRDAANQIVINDPSISRRHATIQPAGEGFVLRDEGSANGIFVNGHKVEGQSLRGGDTVQIGRVRFRFDDQ